MMEVFKIGKKEIERNSEPFIIAEAGINHNGDINLAKKMITTAREAGVDAVKFQTFHTEEFIQDKEEMYTYQSQGIQITESQYEMFKRTEFSEEEWEEIKNFCEKQISFFCLRCLELRVWSSFLKLELTQLKLVRMIL